MGNGITENLTTAVCISNKKINVDKNIINFEKAGDTEQITYTTGMTFNLLLEAVPGTECTYKSMDESVATVNDSGVVTAVGNGTTFVQLYNAKNEMYAAVKVNVNGESNTSHPKIVGGYSHFVALKADGTVWTWGLNDNGQLGLGDNVNRTEPQQAKYRYELEDGTIKEEELTDVIDVAAGSYHTLVLKSDGTVWATGYNRYGQLGNGTTVTSSNFFVQVKGENGVGYLEDIVQITAETETSHALTKNGTVYSWGYNYYGQFGNNTSTSPGVVGSYWPVKMLKVSNVIQISGGDNHLVMLLADSSVWVTGYNQLGQLGLGNTTTKITIPQRMLESGAKEIATGANHTIVLKTDGTVWATGHNGTVTSNRYRILGLGSSYYDGFNGTNQPYIYSLRQVKVGDADTNITDGKHVTASGNVTYVSTNTSGMYTFGDNSYGGLFTENTTLNYWATQVQADKTILTMASTRNSNTGAIVDQDGMVYTVGLNSSGEIGNGTTENLITPWCISNKKINVSKNIINFKEAGETEKIEYNMSMGFNLLMDEIPEDTCTFTSMDENVAKVDENSGEVTAVATGTTYIKLYNKENEVWGAVKVNVNGTGNIAQPKIVGGENHFVALKADGTVWTWGYNGNGELGLGDKTNRIEPTQTNMKNVIDVAAGYNYTLVLKSDGTVWGTGYNGNGELGDGTTTNSNTFHKVKLNEDGEYLENIIAITAESNTSHALKADGSVYSWGTNGNGQFGINTTGSSSYPVKMQKVSNIIQIDAGANHVMMLDADGSVWGVGHNGYGQYGINTTSTMYLPQKMLTADGTEILYGVKEIATGNEHTIILKEDGTVWGTGFNNYGQLGIGNTTYKYLINQVKESEVQEDGTTVEKAITNAKHISAGGYATYISMQKDEEGNSRGMYVAGYNNYGQLFTQNTENKLYATQVETDKDILAMDVTNNYNYQTGAIADQDGMVYTVGYNGNGQMGNDSLENSTKAYCISKVKLKASPSVINYKEAGDTGEKITYSLSATFNLLHNEIEQTDCEYKSLNEKVATVSEDGTVTAQGEGKTYIKVYNKENDAYAAVKVNVNGEQGKTYPKIVSGANHFAALKANGEIWTWGYNGYGNLGLQDSEARIKPTKTNIYDSIDDTQEVYAVDVAAGAYHTLVLKSDGTVWATGYNGYGQLGNGTNTTSNEFVQVKDPTGEGYLEDIIEITANGNTSYALTSDGTVYAWGYNYYGQLGVSDRATRYLPIEMQRVSNIIQISAGENYLVMLDADTSVWSVGYNYYGQLGTGNRTLATIPQHMRNQDNSNILYGVKQVSAGTLHTLLALEDGTALAVGYNGYGQLATGDNQAKYLPVAMIDTEGNVVTNVKEVSANGYSSIISVEPQTKTDESGETVTEAGIYVTGYNNYGQLFTRDTTTLNKLKRVQTDKNIITMASTTNVSYQTSAIADDLGLVYTVGYNGNGEMGDDSTTTTINPASISDATFEVENQRIILNLDSENNSEQIKAATDLGFNLLYYEVEGEEITYNSLDSDIATVSDDGTVTAQSYGKTTVEVSTNKLPNKVLVSVEVLRKDDIAMPKVVSGQNFTVALKADGTVWTWGYNGNGQLGTNDTTNRYKPTKIDVPDMIDIAAGDNHVLLLTKDGKVYSFGSNSYYQLGRTGNTLEPMEIPELENIAEIAASTYSSMALTKQGRVYTWGYNGNGQLGDGTSSTRTTPTKTRLKGIAKIDAKYQTSAAVSGNGELYVWGYNGYGQSGTGTTSSIYSPTQVSSLENIVDVAVEDYTIVALDSNGTVYTSGYNGYGNLGDNTTNTRYSFGKVIESYTEEGEPVYLTDVKEIEAGNEYAIAIKNDGTSMVWGYNGYGQFANGNKANSLIATKLNYSKDGEVIDEIIDVAGASDTITVVRSDGKVWTIGRNNYGQMGDSSILDKTEFTCISNSRIRFEEVPIRIKGINKTKDIKTNMIAGFNLLYNSVDSTNFQYSVKNTAIATIDESTGTLTSVKKGKTQVTVTDTISEEKATVDVYVLGDEDITFPQIESNNYSTVTLKANGQIWSYGYNGYGQLGTGDRSNKILPTYTGIDNIVQIALGNLHTVAVDADGHVWTWGYNGYGQLGDGTTNTSYTKVQVKSPDGEGVLENIVQVAAGDHYSLALDKDGHVYAWGYNGYGNLGLGDSGVRRLPVQVQSLEKITKIEAGNRSSFAIDSDNRLWVAGYNGYGNLGDGTTSSKSTFVRNEIIENVADISASPVDGTITLLLDGTVWGFGRNTYNSLTNVGGAIPQPISTEDGILEDVTAINAGYYAGYAITSDERVVAWGLNNYSQLATGNTTNNQVAKYMKDKDGNDFTDVMLISGGIYNTEIAKNDGTVWSIGYNGYGELGDGTTTSRNALECITTQYITLDEREVTLKLSNPDYQINPKTIYGFNLLYDVAENNGFKYSSSNTDVATVDENTGKVTAKGLGRTYITLKSNSGEYETRVVIDVIAESKKTVEKVATGYIHSLALKQDGTIWTWGDNSNGEIGNGLANGIRVKEPTRVEKGVYTEIIEDTSEDGSIVTTTTKVEKELNDIVDIAAGNSYNLAVDAEGKVWAWGYNGYGQLGDNTNVSQYTPTRIDGLEDIKKVYINGNTSIAINNNGEIYVWGYGYSRVPTKITFYSKVVAVTGRLILAEDGTVWNLSSNPTKIAELSNIVEIASGDNYSAALDSKGHVWAWGYNGYGQLGQGNTTRVDVPVQIPIEDIIEIVTGNNSIIMTNKYGELYSCGYNGNGQLGLGNNTTSIVTATKAEDIDNIKLTSSSIYHSVVSDNDGFVHTSGYNGYGELGDGTLNDKNIFTLIGDTYVNVHSGLVTLEKDKTFEIQASLDNKFNLIEDVVDSSNMEYKSLNENIATVDENGIITGKQTGKAEIVVTHTITNKVATVFVNVVPEDKQAVPEVEISDTHSAALKADGTVWTWGDNTYGQLGTGDNNAKASPIKVTALENIIDISVGYYNTVCVKEDGTVWSFGYNGYGQLGDGTGSERNTPVQVIKEDGTELKNIVKVAAGTYKTVALDADGNVWIWGYRYGSTARKLSGLEKIIDISANYAADYTGKVFKIDDLTELEVENVIRISEGYNHTLLLRQDGKGYSFGENGKGQLGLGNSKNCDIPTFIKSTLETELTDIKELKAGKEFSMAVLENGDTYVWGSNENYKLATTQETNQVYPKKNDKIQNTMFIEAGAENGAIIDNDGFVYTWGLGKYGALGNKLYNTTSTPVLVGRQDVGLDTYNITIHKGEEHQITVTNKTFNVLKDVVDKGVMNYTSGSSNIASVSSTGLVTGIKEGKTTIVVNKDGTEYTSIAQVTVLPDDVDIEPMALTCGSHTTILKADGTVWSYGVNSSYQLGNGTSRTTDTPVQVSFSEGVIIKQIAVGNTHNLALDTDGNVWGWGANSNYALGTTASIPVKLGLTNIKKIAANNDQSIAITEDGYVYVWGLNANGELGTRTYETVRTPTLLPYINDIVDVSIGKNHTLLLTTSGKVLASGLNVYGQTAKTEGKSNTFEEITLEETIGQIAAGDNHSVLLTASGEVYTFGYNLNGQLGNGNNENQTTPTKVTGITKIMQISAGKEHTVLLGENRKLYSTGGNSQGELGIGNNNSKELFTEIETVSNMMSISAGNTYSVAINYDGDVYGWGDYYHGVQNIKTKTNSRVPVKIGNNESYAEEPEVTVNVDGTKQIKIIPKYIFNVFKDNEIVDDFRYEAINEEIATVNEKGIITGISVGTTWVKAIEEATGKEIVIIVRVIGEGQKYAPQVSGGENFASVLKADGSIWSFGYNSDGQLGNDKLVPLNVPSQTNIISTYKKVVTGKSFTMALRDDGTVWAWGDNTYGVLGQGNRTSAKKPIQVQVLENIVDIAAGDNHAIAIDNMGNIYTWGLNSSGQLGNGNTKTVTMPERINGVENQVVSISAGGNMTSIVDAEGKVYVFGDNSNEVIAELTYDLDEYGQKIQPATNLYYAEPQMVANMTNAVKVQCMENAIVVLKTDGSIEKVSKYAKQENANIEEIASESMVDINSANLSTMALDKSGNMYTYGNNKNGQAGIGGTSDSVTLQKIHSEDKKYISVGAGYKNNYVIDTEGFVYAAGNNTYGQLGNGLYEDSFTFTLVGDREFKIIPEARTMAQPEEEKVSVEANVFNVFNNNTRKLIDYDWSSSNTDVATVENGVITSQDMGEVTITATDKATGATATALRVIQPLDEQRIDSIYVNNVAAKLSGENKYEVDVIANPDGTGTLRIQTKDSTDSISIDGGATYVTGTFLQDIDLDSNPKIVKIKVKASNEKTVDFILTINVLSENTALKSLTVDGVEATPIGTTEYEIVISNEKTKPEITAITEDSKAEVSIENAMAEVKQSTRTVDMVTRIKKVVPIQVVSESGNSVTYTLTIYKEDALTELESLTVDGVEATNISRNTYKIIVDSDKESSQVVATTVYPTAEVQINNLGADVNVTTRTVSTLKDQTIVKVYVTAKENEREYTLIIEKEQTQIDLGLFAVIVDGTVINPTEDVYEAYIDRDATSVEVKAITVDANNSVEIEGYDSEVNTTIRNVTFDGTDITYEIKVTDATDSTNSKVYKLNLIVDTNTDLAEITVNGESATKLTSSTYKILIDSATDNSEVVATTADSLAEVEIEDLGAEVNVTTQNIETTEEQTIVKITVTGNERSKEYTLIIEKETEGSTLELYAVIADGEIINPVSDVYEVYVPKGTTSIEVKATTINSTDLVSIGTNSAEVNVTTQTVEVNGDTTYTITVTDPTDSTLYKEYALNIIEDISYDLASVKVNNLEATKLNDTTYKAIIDYDVNVSEVIATTYDSTSEVEINDLGKEVNITTKEVTTDALQTTVKIYVTARESKKEYTLIIEKAQSESDLGLFAVTVNGIVINPTENVYEAYVDRDATSVEVKAITIDENNLVEIGGFDSEVNTTIRNVTFNGTDITYEIKVTDATDSTNSKVYKLKLIVDTYTDLAGITVNGASATKLTSSTYKILIDSTTDISEVTATTVVPSSEVEIEDLGEEVNITTQNIETTADQTIVKVTVTGNGRSKEYTLIIEKSAVVTNLELFAVTVNGIVITPNESVYEAYVPENTTSVEVRATTISEEDLVNIGDNEKEVHTTTKTVSIDGDTTYIITVTNPDDSEDKKEYVLNIKEAISNTKLKSLTIGNEEFSQEATRIDGTNIYEASIPEEYEVIDVIAVTSYELADVCIDDNEYEQNVTTREVSITDEVTQIKITVKAQNGDTEEYTLKINRKNSNKNLLKVTVDGNEAQLSATEKDTYEYTLDKITDSINIGAITEYEKSYVGINTYEKEENATYRDVEMVGKSIVTYITVTAEDGTSKEYKLIVNALPDNVKLLSVKVNGNEATPVPTNKYEAKVNKNDTSFELYVIPEDSKAKVQIGENTEVTGTASTTIAKTTEDVEVTIKVTAQDGTVETYTLVVSNKSDDCNIGMIKVDGEVITANEEDGKYYVNKKYLTESVDVEAIANNSLSTVSINSSTPTLEKQLSNVTTPDEVNYIIVEITAEDDTSKQYTVVVNKLSNNASAEMFITMEIDGVTETIEFDENNKARVKIGNNESVELKGVLEDSLATISINGSLAEKATTTQNVVTIDEETTATIETVAQDGTQENYAVTLVRDSSDNTLESLTATGIDAENILKTSDNTYTIEMPDTMDELNLTAIATDENATVQIEGAEFSETNEATGIVDVPEGTKTFEIIVKAENGDENIYTITVNKVTDLGLSSVKANDIECEQEDGAYVMYIDADVTEVGLSITPNNPAALVSTQIGIDGEFTDPEANSVHVLNVPITSGEDATVLINVQDPNDESRIKTYSVIIKEKSHEAGLELIQVDGKDAINMVDKYYAVTTMDETNANVYIKATNSYATVKIESIGEEKASINKDVTLDTAKTTTLSITITAQDGITSNSYTLEIERKSNDTSCVITVNNETPEEYDATTNTYTKYIERSVDESSVEVVTTSETATVEIAGETVTQVLSKTVSTANEQTTVDIIVKSESGDTETYHVDIVKKSTDNTIASVKVDKTVIEETDGKYVATILDNGKDTRDAAIEVITNNKNATVQIGDGTEWFTNIANSTVTFKDGNRVITLNINVKAQDSGTEMLTKQLEITIVSDDNTIKSVKNGDREVTIYNASTHTYTEYVDKSIEEVTLAIEANSVYTTLTSDTTTGTGVISIGNIDVKDQDEVTVKFTATSETGREQEYTIVIRKMSDNANATHIYVDGEDIIDKFEHIDDVPTYILSIEKLKDLAQIGVQTENEYATVKIGDTDTGTYKVTRNIGLDLEENSITVPILITSQDGNVTKTYNIMFIRISNNTNIQWLEINDKHIIENDDGNYETTVKASAETAKVEITLEDVLAKVTMGGNVEVGTLTETIILPETGDTVKTITVTAQDGTISTHNIIIHKQENDLGLNEVYLDNRIATRIDDTTFEIDVVKGTTNAEIKAIANKATEYVSISDNERTIKENTYTDCKINNGEVKIKVIAMFGEGSSAEIDQEKEYTLIIKEVEEPIIIDDLRTTIKVDDEIITPDTDGKYVKVLPEETDNAVVWAEVNSETSKVKIKDVNGETEYTNPSAQKNISLQDGVTEVTAIVENGAGTTKEHVIYLVKDNEPIDDAELKNVIADDVEIDKNEDGTYTVNIDKDAESTKIEAIANYEYAKVSIDGNVPTRGTNTNTIDMTDISKKTIKIAVTSITGTTEQYVVNIVKEQDELALDSIFMNNRIAKQIDETTYEIDVEKGTETVNLQAITAHEESYVQIVNNEPTLHTNNFDNYLLKNGTSVNITVYNSDKTDSRTYTLNIKEKTVTLEDLRASIRVDGEEVSADTDGNYVVVVDKDKAKANVWAGTNSITSKVNIIDNQTAEETGYEVLSTTKDIELTSSTTKVTVKVMNGADQEKTYTLYIIKNGEETDDVSLKSLVANDIEIEAKEDGNYVIEIARDVEEVKLVATTTLETSKLSIQGNEQTRHVNTETIKMENEDKKIITIVVTSISGQTKEYTVEIHKEHEDLELDSIYVDGRKAIKVGENQYSIDVKEDTNNVNIEAVAYINTNYVQIDGNVQAVGKNTYNNYSVEDETIVPVKVFNEDMSNSKDYTLVINRTTEELKDLTPEIKVDGKTILPDVDGIYVAVVNESKLNAILWAGVDRETSSVKIDSSEYKTPSITENVELTEKETTKTVSVTNGAGEEKQYTVLIIKESEDIYDANLQKLIAGSGASTEGEVVAETDGTYSIEITKDATQLKLTAIADYEYAKVSIDGNGWTRGSNSNTVEIGDAEEKTVIVKVESVSGIIKNYIVNIYRTPEELEIKNVYVDNRLATKVSDTEYTIDVVNTKTEVDIKAVLYNIVDEYVAINGNTPEIGENTYVAYELVNGNTVSIKVTNGLDDTDENYKEKVYTLTITQVGETEDLSDLQLEISVNNKIIEKAADGIYIATVDGDSNTALVGAKSNSKTTKVKIDDSEYQILSIEKYVALTDNITKVNVHAVNGAGDEIDEEVWIVKGTENAELAELKANDEVIVPQEDGTYLVRAQKGIEQVKLDATATQELAYVSIDENEKTRGTNTNTIDIKDVETKEVVVKVESLDGTIKEYTVIIDRRMSITGKVITQAEDQTNQSATITLYRTDDTREEDDETDPREVVKQIEINPDGTYELMILPDKYDIVVNKVSYLEYRLTDIELEEDIELDDISILAGDVVETGEIEIDDLVDLNDNYATITDENKDEKEKYDLNEDGVVDKLDRNILKANYGKKAEIVEWVNPKAISLMSLNDDDVSSTSFIVPMTCSYSITSEYGYRVHPTTGEYKKHTGIDLAGTWHTEILAVADGEVTFAGVQNGFGNCVEIKHVVNGEIVYSFYAHLSRIDVKAGDIVKQGEVIGLEGGDPESDPNPGSSTGHHLHFEIRSASGYGNDVDPNDYIDF